MLNKFMIIMTTAGAAALLTATAETASSPSVGTLDGLGEMGFTVCVNSASSSVVSYVENNNNRGAGVHESPSFATMMEDLFDGKCEAVIYDSPLLEQALANAQEEGDGIDFGLVGEMLNNDPYGE
jgi:ABC-type amino acid transport substrate-binding protein